MIYNVQSFDNTISWAHDSRTVLAQLPGKVENTMILRDSDGIAVVFSATNQSRDNAMLLDADGRIRANLKNPFPTYSDVVFYYFNYVGSKLVVAMAGSGTDYAADVNEENGECGPVRESR